MEKILSEFGVQPVLLAAQVVNFLILLFILKKFLYGPILKVLETRKSKIAESLKNAEEIENRLLKTEEEKEKVIKKAIDESRKIVEEAKQAASGIIEEAHHKAKNDIAGLILKSELQIKQEKEKMQLEIRQELADMVAAGLKVVAGKVLTEKDKKELVESSVKNLN